ncbi:LysR family transcriptional regulator [Butyrivibrio sp. LC3010]|uniref:LysR family transcriptional regulator n=1 Tax=Butyrivibrio sp. LC3010 TaxID=1280680 RepID=UPI0004242D78|nr:LysR family transcriptional regulator [Butyrivibrio sp. LC3010]
MAILDRKIKYFICVVESGSFSAAAKELYLSQANLSKQISSLEAELGVKLFDRTGYKPKLTEAGRILYDRVISLPQIESDILSDIMSYRQSVVSVGFTGVSENRELVEAIKMFQYKYPDISINLTRYDFSGSVDALLQGKIDISFGLEAIFNKSRELNYDILHGYTICFLCNKEHSLAKHPYVTVEDIKKEPIVILSKKYNEDYYNDFMEACKKDGYKPNVKKKVDSLDELIMSVVLGDGAALYGDDIQEKSIKAVPILDTAHSPNYVAAYKKESISAAAGAFLSFIKDYFETL